MLHVNSLAELAALEKPVHWAMGFFDGVHAGHQRVIASAATPGALRGVLTFEPHPLAVLKPLSAPLLLTPDTRQKAALMEALGVEVLLTLPFTRELADTAAEDFLRALCAACGKGVAGVSVGSNWRFGKGGGGDAALLHRLAPELGFRVCKSELLTLPGGEVVCSSAIRNDLAAGRLEVVEAMLGRPFGISGTVEHGQHLARKLGFPTANITLPPQTATPPFGVYRVEMDIRGSRYTGMANLGLRPTIKEAAKPIRLETHILNFSEDIYGDFLEIHLREFIRPERTFPSLAALKIQVESDIAACAAAHAWEKK